MGNRERSPRGDTIERWAVALWLAASALLLYATLGAQLARAAETTSDVGAGTLLFRSDAGFDPAAPLSTDVRMSIAGIVARVTIVQRFRNPSASEWAEAVYALPLPDDAAVDRLSMRIGDRLIEGEIREREEAERVYREARDSGRRASIVSQTTPNLFTTAVANIGPGKWIDITIEYLQTARYDSGELAVRLPLTLTPRYRSGEPSARTGSTACGSCSPSTAPLGHGADTAPTEDDSSAPPTVAAGVASEAAISVVLAPGIELAGVATPQHDSRVTRDGDRYLIETATARVPMDRDFIVAWRPKLGEAPAIAALAETRGDTTYALLMLLPPANAASFRTPPREVIFVVDTSGSMAGQSLEQAKGALANGLARLTAADRFNIVQFDATTSTLYPAPMPLTARTFAEALRYVERLTADGGTEMEPAIRTALAQPAAAGFLRQVIFLTDGAVANETGLFALIKDRLGDARLFTVGIGSAPNSYFMRKAAQFGRGSFTHVGRTDAVAGEIEKLLDKLERTALTDVLVDWPDALEVYPHQVPDLYAGEPVVIVGSFPANGGEPVTITVSGRAAGAPWADTVTIVPTDAPGIASLWARRKIEFLLDSRVDGVREELIRALVLDVALEHGLVSPYTSLVAVDRTPARSAAAALARRAVANAAPAGSTYATLPQTATGAPLYRLLGVVLLLVAAAGVVARRRGALR